MHFVIPETQLPLLRTSALKLLPFEPSAYAGLHIAVETPNLFPWWAQEVLHSHITLCYDEETPLSPSLLDTFLSHFLLSEKPLRFSSKEEPPSLRFVLSQDRSDRLQLCIKRFMRRGDFSEMAVFLGAIWENGIFRMEEQALFHTFILARGYSPSICLRKPVLHAFLNHFCLEEETIRPGRKGDVE
jgi:hypothetical protein